MNFFDNRLGGEGEWGREVVVWLLFSIFLPWNQRNDFQTLVHATECIHLHVMSQCRIWRQNLSAQIRVSLCPWRAPWWAMHMQMSVENWAHLICLLYHDIGCFFSWPTDRSGRSQLKSGWSRTQYVLPTPYPLCQCDLILNCNPHTISVLSFILYQMQYLPFSIILSCDLSIWRSLWSSLSPSLLILKTLGVNAQHSMQALSWTTHYFYGEENATNPHIMLEI